MTATVTRASSPTVNLETTGESASLGRSAMARLTLSRTSAAAASTSLSRTNCTTVTASPS